MYTLYLFTENPELKAFYVEKMNAKETQNDAGIDLYVPKTIKASQTHTGTTLFLDHQVICRMTKTYKNDEKKEEKEVAVSYYLYPRSSISKTPFRLANSVGIIDAGYRGNIIAALDIENIRGDDYTLEMGQRIVQICAPTLEPVRLVVCDTKDDMDMNTSRSAGGFGSTGK